MFIYTCLTAMTVLTTLAALHKAGWLRSCDQHLQIRVVVAILTIEWLGASQTQDNKFSLEHHQ